jgi:UDP-glucose:glycoprotein glucosyltransferase
LEKTRLTVYRETAAEENATAYFPILDRIAEGYFTQATTPQDLYTKFLELLQDEGHITDPATLSSFQLALSVHSAAPRIEAHYQFYKTSVEPLIKWIEGYECDIWVAFQGKQYCDPQLKESRGPIKVTRFVDIVYLSVCGC